MNNNLDYLNKIEVDTFMYSTAKEDRIDCRPTKYLGRSYTKWGEYQVVTFFGIKYKVQDLDTGKSRYVLFVGMAKQHPEDIHHDKKVAIENARIAALIDPFMIIKDIPEEFDRECFKEMVKPIAFTMDLDFVLTKEEYEEKVRKFWGV